jgi:putative heme-binding domain-containing protein
MTRPAALSLHTRLSLLIPVLIAFGLFRQASVAAAGAQSTGGAQPAGDVARGQTIFTDKGNCLSCHRVADQGSYMGPNLSAIGASLTSAELQKAILDPGLEVKPQNRLYKVVTSDGKTITGRLLNQDVYIVQMLTSEARLVTFKKSSLRLYDFAETPPMPSYRNKLTAAEQADLIAYLLSLQGVVKQ